MNDGRVRVLYVAGEGRSGSTLLAAILGNRPGLFPVGELRGIWRALQVNELCGCGQPFADCRFWRRVGSRAFGGWHRVDLAAMLTADTAFARHRRVPRLIASALGARESAALREYRRQLGLVYAAIQEVSGCSVVVDSTKDPAYALLLLGVPNVDLRVVHLVRDSRGVAYSWSKTDVERPQYANHPWLRQTFMSTRRPLRTALEWDVKNALLHWIGPTTTREVVTYESLMSDPDAEIRRMLRLVSDCRSVEDSAAGELEFHPFHTIGGNRVRFQRGQLRLRPDDEWKSRLPGVDRRIVTLVTFPLLVKYGYVNGAWAKRLARAG